MLAWSWLHFGLCIYTALCILYHSTALFFNIGVLFLPALQTYEVAILFAVYFLYVYARPYKATFVNILELALLAYLGIFLILAKDFQQNAATSSQLNATSVDSCGKAVPTISTEWIVLGVLYFLPITVLVLLVVRWLLCSRGFQY